MSSPKRPRMVKHAMKPERLRVQRLDTRSSGYELRASLSSMPVDLSKTLVKRYFSPRVERSLIKFCRLHFGHLVWLYRLGLGCFLGRFFVTQGILAQVMDVAMILGLGSLVMTLLFLSLDILHLLIQQYEFWFITIFNALLCLLFGLGLGRSRTLMCVFGGLTFQSSVLVDANIRSFRRVIASVVIGLPVQAVICALFSFQLIRDEHAFHISVHGKTKCDLADLVVLVMSNLGLFLVKIVVLKSRRTCFERPGFTAIPCAVIKVRLRLCAVSSLKVLGGAAITTRTTDCPNRSQLSIQQLILGKPPLTFVDVRRTLLPSRYWDDQWPWINWTILHQRALRNFLYMTGAVGYCALLLSVSVSAKTDLNSSEGTRLDGIPRLRMLAYTGFICTVLFCGSFVLFYQRDLIKLLLRNFDVLFSSIQFIIFSLCLCDMDGWKFETTLVTASWMIWFHWALTLDALTPDVKARLFRFSKRLAAPVTATILAANCTVFYALIFAPSTILVGRELFQLKLPFSSTPVLSIRTDEMILGRVVTMVMWCSRQVVVLLTSKEDELNFIRGLVEFLSPYDSFPSRAVNEPQNVCGRRGRGMRNMCFGQHRAVVRPLRISGPHNSEDVISYAREVMRS